MDSWSRNSLNTIRFENFRFKVYRKRRLIGFFFISIGLVLVGLGYFYNPVDKVASLIYTPDNQYLGSQEPIKPSGDVTIGVYREELAPVGVKIPDLAIDLVVRPAKVLEGRWEVYPDVASFGIGSALPGYPGNQVIFAHARPGLFLPLKKAKVGMRVNVVTRDQELSYLVTEIKEVFPSQVEVIKPTEDETLTLYTCSGFNDSKRLIVSAKRI